MRNQTHAPLPPAAIPAFAPDLWLYQVFSPLAVAGGLPLRRSVAEVETRIGRARFLAEAGLRGYRIREEAGQFHLDLDRKPIPVMV